MKIFLDSSVVVSALISDIGASAKLFALCEAGNLEGFISKDVLDEVLDVIKRKFPPFREDFLQRVKIFKIVKKANKKQLKLAAHWIKDPNDIKILVGAKNADVDYLLTLDVKHFINDQEVTKKSGLRILTPGAFLESYNN